MSSRTRRDFLKLFATSAPALALTNQTADYTASAHSAGINPARTPAYIDPLPIPKRLHPYKTAGDRAEYHVRMLECRQRLHSQLPPARLWGFEGQYPGPTFDVERGHPITVEWEN